MLRRLLAVVAVVGVVLAGAALPSAAETDFPFDGPVEDPPAAEAAQAGNRVVTAVGDVEAHGGPDGVVLDEPLIDMVPTAAGDGYWLLAEDGGVFNYGGARFHGSTGGLDLFAPVVAFAPTRSGRGYYFVAEDGGVFSFGRAPFHGALPDVVPLELLAAPVIGMVPTSTQRGYWLVAEDGGVFTFGDAPFLGSLGDTRRRVPVVGMAPAADNLGYWLIDEWGQVYPFGEARLHGYRANNIDTVADIHGTPSGEGYWVLRRSGRIEAYGDAASYAETWDLSPDYRVPFPSEPGVAPVALAADPGGGGLWVATTGDYRVARGDEVGPHRFIEDRGGVPTRWNPCAPIGWYYDPAGEPFDAEPFMHQAFGYLAEATGLTFDFRGATPLSRGDHVVGAITVHWEQLGGPAGLAGPRHSGDGSRWASGEVMLNGSAPVSPIWYGPGWGIVAVHEIAHALGLSHVEDDRQVMFPVAGAWRLGEGDLEGLRRVGRSAGCL